MFAALARPGPFPSPARLIGSGPNGLGYGRFTTSIAGGSAFIDLALVILKRAAT
jgi:hypothetical protein